MKLSSSTPTKSVSRKHSTTDTTLVYGRTNLCQKPSPKSLCAGNYYYYYTHTQLLRLLRYEYMVFYSMIRVCTLYTVHCTSMYYNTPALSHSEFFFFRSSFGHSVKSSRSIKIIINSMFGHSLVRTTNIKRG